MEVMIVSNIIFLIFLVPSSYSFDEYSTSCIRPGGGRLPKTLPEPPCDFTKQQWCTSPGSAYPWRAVRRFVTENQGLMRRMYGEMRQISVLRAEYESNDVLYHGDGSDFQLIRDTVTKRYKPTITSSISSDILESNRKNTNNRVVAATSPTKSTSTSTTTTTTARSSTTPTTTLLDNITEITTDLEQEDTTIMTTITLGPPINDITTESDDDDEEVEEEDGEEDGETDEEITEGDEQVEVEQVDEDQDLVKADPPLQQQQPQLLRRGINACPVKEEVVAPFWANNTRGEVLALLNLYPFEQYVHWEKCTDEFQQMFCRDGCRCEQQYRLHRLLAYDPRNECRGIFSDWFRFPSCCVCKCYDIPAEFRLTSRSPRKGNNNKNNPETSSSPPPTKTKKVGVKSKLEKTEDSILKQQEQPNQRINNKIGELRMDLEAVVHHAQPSLRARSFEAFTMGPIDAATPHFYYQSHAISSNKPFAAGRRPRK